MIRSVVVITLLIGIAFSAQSQETPKGKTKTITRINIPGTFLVDLGLNFALSAPDNFDHGFWGSRTVNLYYQYPIRIGKSSFSAVPGMGLGLERFKLTNNYTLSPNPGTDGTYALIPATDLVPDIKKSMIVANYFDIPFEIRFDANPDDVSRSFNMAVGGRVGFLFDASTKIKYREDSETKILKDKQNHGLNDIRYGLYTRIGIGGFNWFFFYNTSSLFKTDQGPDKTDMNTITAGISINGF